MKVNAKSLADLRKRSAWSQDELATASGLSLRTVQRIENLGTASLQSMKAIASALEVDLEDFEHAPEKAMNRWEYKTLAFRPGFFKKGVAEIEKALNSEGKEGWQFKQMVLLWNQMGGPDSVVAIFERSID